MNLVTALEYETNTVYTENGDIAYSSTLDANLDFFGLAGASRYDQNQVLELFQAAFHEDPVLALKNLLYLRDIRTGLGERKSFRTCFRWLCKNHVDHAKKLVPYIPVYGRYDDLFATFHTPVEDVVFSLISKQLDKDLENSDGNISLLSKWLPSINASNSLARGNARYICQKLDISYSDYRKMLSSLRKGRIIENNLRLRDYSFDYSQVSAGAMHRYQHAFCVNDLSRYTQYVSSVEKKEASIHADTLYPYQIIKEYHKGMSEIEKKAMQLKWNQYPRSESETNTIVVRDGSGSMLWPSGLPYAIATSMAILFAEQLKGTFKNKFITFSSYPKLICLDGDLYDVLTQISKYDDCTNTNIEAVYNLILKALSKVEYTKENQIDRIVIISDMEFDEGTTHIPTFELFEQKFKALGYDLPEMVYWNVNARRPHFSATPENSKIHFVSGASAHVIENILSQKPALDAKEFMLETLSKYLS